MIENKIIKRRLIRVKGEGEEESDEKVERNIERERERRKSLSLKENKKYLIRIGDTADNTYKTSRT